MQIELKSQFSYKYSVRLNFANTKRSQNLSFYRTVRERANLLFISCVYDRFAASSACCQGKHAATGSKLKISACLGMHTTFRVRSMEGSCILSYRIVLTSLLCLCVVDVCGDVKQQLLFFHHTHHLQHISRHHLHTAHRCGESAHNGGDDVQSTDAEQ